MNLDHVAHLDREIRAFARTLDGADETTVVPSCPGWDLRELTVHLGGVHRWATAHLDHSRDADATHDAGPREGERLRPWFRAGADALLDALARHRPDEPCWTIYPPGITATWARRQALETAVHRWDAESALGLEARIDPALAVDGIREVLDDMVPRQLRLGRQSPLTTTIELRVDGLPAGHRRFLLGGFQSGHEAAPSAVIAGDPETLLLLLWGRRPLDDPRLSRTGSAAALIEVLGARLVP